MKHLNFTIRIRKQALDYLTNYSKGKMETVLEMYNDLHDKLIVKYSNSR